MFYKISKGKYVISSNGCYIAYTPEELEQLKLLLADIDSGKEEFLKKDNRND